MQIPGNAIIKTEVTMSYIVITLANGVVINLSSNPEYLHMSFSGIETPLTVGPFHKNQQINSVHLANYVDLSYTPKEQ